MRISVTHWTTCAVVAVIVAGCGGRAGARATTAPTPAGAASAELEDLYWARLDSARTRFTEADVRFMTGMIGHHGQAIVMARLAPGRGASPAVQTLAARVINAQNDEIAIMQQWLRDRKQSVPEVHIEGTQLMVHGAEHALHMPGMLTAEQLRQLEQARGQEFDRLFLTFMIQHHRGAMTMVHDLFRTVGAGQDQAVFKFASDVQVDQATEVARMERMLTGLPARGGAR